MTRNTRGRLGIVLLASLSVIATLLMPLSGPASANHGDRSLEVTPETPTRGVGATQTLTARLCVPQANPPSACGADAPNTPFSNGPIRIRFENENGVNDPDASTSRTTPDRECSIAFNQTSCSITYTGNNSGNDVWRVWIDHDDNTSTDESDAAEGRDETAAPGTGNALCRAAPNEPDCTDVVQVTWSAGGPTTLDCDDRSAPDTEREQPSDEGASSQTYDCFVRDHQGNPTNDADPNTDGQQNITVNGEVENGINDPDAQDGASYESPDYTCVVGSGTGTPVGQCSVRVRQADKEAGTSEICWWIGNAAAGSTLCADEPTGENQQANGSDTGDDLADQTEKTWGPMFLVDCDDSGPPDTEREKNPTGGTSGNEIYNCQVRDQYGNATGDNDPDTNGNQTLTVKGENENGANDNDDSASYDSPDHTCNASTTAGSVGQCSMTVTQAELQEGLAPLCFWVGEAATGAAECLDEPTGENQQQDGSDTGNDLADRAELTWEPRSADEGSGRLDAEPETASVNTGSDHTITATVYDQFGSPFQGNTQVNFEFFQDSPSDGDLNTPLSPDKTCTTNNSSSCSIEYTSNETGRDLVCVWINDAPNMVGNNQNGTCNDEGRNDAGDTEGSAEAPQDAGDDVDVVSVSWVNATPANELNCDPETGKSRRSASKTITCTASAGGNGVAGENIDIELTGAKDKDGNSPQTPDFTCTTNNTGVCTITHGGGSSSQLGKSTYRAWIDPDHTNETVEADPAEGRDETATAGDVNEPDGTDVVEHDWVPNPKRSISLDSSHRRRKSGKKVRLSVDIDGDRPCRDDQTVQLKARADNGRFQTIGTGTTDEDGELAFTITVKSTRDYRADAPKSSAFGGTCQKAISNVVRVRAT